MIRIRNHRADSDSIRYDESPNRSTAFAPEGIVIHDTAGRLDKLSSVRWLKNPDARASAHFVVERDGDITQLVPLNRQSWHAGKSSYKGRNNVNGFAFGIEIVNLGKVTKVGASDYSTWFKKTYRQGEDGLEFLEVSTPHHGHGHWHDYTEAQLASVHDLCVALIKKYDVKWISTHWFISPGRKVDTNPLFPLEELHASLFGHGTDTKQDEPYVTAAVNQRRWPSYHDNIITVIPKGAKIVVLREGLFRSRDDVEEKWYLVEHGGNEGWVNGMYVQV